MTVTYRLTDGTSASTTFPAGGLGIDQNGDGTIDADEGFSARVSTATVPTTILFVTDGIRQTGADQIQLVRVIQAGIDVDGDGTRTLDPARIYAVGNSLGAGGRVQFSR
jgi:hypothetical protein